MSALLHFKGCGERGSGEKIRAVGLTPEQIGERIVHAREEMRPKPWSQFDLAIALGVSPSTIYRWEKGRLPSVPELRRVEEALNQEPGYLTEPPERRIEFSDLEDRLDALNLRLGSVEVGLEISREAVLEILASIHDQLVRMQEQLERRDAQSK